MTFIRDGLHARDLRASKQEDNGRQANVVLTMPFKLVMAAAKTWRRLKGENQLPKVVQGITFRNGVEVTDTPAQNAA